MLKPVFLFVDDEEFILNSLKIQLRNEFQDSFCFETAECASEALEIIQELQTENINVIVIVSDWLMPGMKGDEFLIKVHHQFPNIVKVMLTGQANNAAVNRAKEQADLFAVLHKPWQKNDLIETIKLSLQKINFAMNFS